MKIIVSACLLGIHCRYSGDGCYNEAVAALAAAHELIPVCPEQLGGLPTPREPNEIVGGEVMTKNGNKFTRSFEKGAREVLKIAKLLGCTHAVLKSRSPSCGSGKIYDGTFSGTLIDGDGVTAKLLKENGILVFSEESLQNL
ncbi:DUF523 domain-containing protein [Synergistaceae bacterium OttesenSCG-928-D05]|nr:DUF523 domain-containing protein [Synergistaceae bacterium OttesenSCG-928-D05]